ncbi:MAG: hypothetical protein EXQ52_14800 [Bryobacterales bacterium]|nr:hypothetical protein [Bryobacterales bacterium]
MFKLSLLLFLVGLVHRPKGTNLPGGVFHDKVSEVCQVLEGTGTLVTGGTLVNPAPRAQANDTVVQIIPDQSMDPESVEPRFKTAQAAAFRRVTSSSFRRARPTGSRRFRNQSPTP